MEKKNSVVKAIIFGVIAVVLWGVGFLTKLWDSIPKTGITLKSCRRQVGAAAVCSPPLCAIPLVPASPPAHSNTSVAVPSFPLSSLFAPSKPSPALEPE